LHPHVPGTRRGVLPLAALVLAAALAASCQPFNRKPVFPVTGSVYFQGRPAEGVRVAFRSSRDPGDRCLCPQGVVAADGSFRLTTYTADDGAPPGAYFVLLYWPAPGPDDDVHVHPDRLRGRYADPKTTPLTATVPTHAVVLDRFDLK
jgi:hypothetical protein